MSDVMSFSITPVITAGSTLYVDAIEASEVTSYRTAQFGEAGDDFLFGGKQVDVLDGGLGTDSAPSTDRFRDQITSIEKFF